jgi:hypothetical protein
MLTIFLLDRVLCVPPSRLKDSPLRFLLLLRIWLSATGGSDSGENVRLGVLSIIRIILAALFRSAPIGAPHAGWQPHT